MATQIALNASGTKLNFDSNTFVIDESSNRVGIGTTSPYYKFHAVGDGLFGTDSSNGRVYFGDPSSGDVHYIGAISNNLFLTTSGYVRVSSGGSERVRIDSSGNVGIGTTNPSMKLEVNAGTTNEVALFESTDTGVEIQLKDSTGTSKIESRGDFRFHTKDVTNAVKIEADGNVGIGTTSPSMKLEVNGGLKIHQNNTYSITGSGGSETLNIANDGFIKIDQTSSAQDLYTITFNSGNPSAGQILLLKVDDGNTGAVTLKHSSDQNGFNIGSDITLVQNGHKVIQLVHTGWAWSAIGHD